MARGRQGWAEIAARWERGGETQRVFASRIGVPVETVRSWIYRQREQRKTKPASKLFEVRVSPAPTPASFAEIMLPTFVAIRVAPCTDASWASSLAKALLA